MSKTQQPKVSIVVPVYNSGHYVERCLNSIKQQCYDNIEVILVDDGSTDGSGAVVDALAAATAGVSALHQHNQGPAAARRTGALKATGYYIMFADSDDTLPQGALQSMVSISQREDLDAFYGTFNRVADGKVIAMPPRSFEGVVDRDQMLINSIDPNFSYHAAICFSKRVFWDAHMFCDDRNLPSEDVITNIKLIMKCNRIGVYNTPIYDYHLVGTSLTMTGKYFKQPYFKNFFNQLKAILEENGKLELTRDYVCMKEIMSFAFMVKDIDTSDEWYKQVLNYDVDRYPRKIRLVHRLLRYPRLLKLMVDANRQVKRVFG